MGSIPATTSDESTLVILLVLACEIAVGLLYGFIFATVLRRRERTSRKPDPKGGLRVVPLTSRRAIEDRKAA